MNRTKKAVSFTIRTDLLQWLDVRVRKTQSNRSQLVEKALKYMKDSEIKDQLDESFKRMRGDEEIQELSEMGFEDYLMMNDEKDSTR